MSLLVVGDNGGEAGRDASALGGALASLLNADVARVQVVRDPASQASATAGAESATELEVRAGGSPARVLHELAQSRHAAMLVLGSSHRAGPGRIYPGGVAERLLQGGPCPIAVAPAGYAGRDESEPRVIGVAFDDSAESHRALSLAAELGQAASAALRVIAVFEGLAPSENPRLGPPTAYEQLQEALHEAVRPLPSSLRAEPRFRTGDPADVVLAETELGIDLLVMGSRGYGPLQSVFLGSVSERIVRAVECPVVIVPRGAPPTERSQP